MIVYISIAPITKIVRVKTTSYSLKKEMTSSRGCIGGNRKTPIISVSKKERDTTRQRRASGCGVVEVALVFPDDRWI